MCKEKSEGNIFIKLREECLHIENNSKSDEIIYLDTNNNLKIPLIKYYLINYGNFENIIN